MDNLLNFILTPFVGIITNVNDPEKLGRVQVCAFGYNIRTAEEYQAVLKYAKENFDSVHSKTDEIPVAYWASVLAATTSAGFSGIGTGHGLRPGSVVMGVYMDGNTAQSPIITGVFTGMYAQLKIDEETRKLRTDNFGKSKLEIGNVYESQDRPGVNRLCRNEEVDKTIMEIRKRQLQKSTTAHEVKKNIESFKSLEGIIKPSAVFDKLKEGLKDASKMDQIKNEFEKNLLNRMSNVISPDKILESAIRKQQSLGINVLESQKNELKRTIDGTKCTIAKFADQMIDAAATAALSAISDFIEQNILPENFLKDATAELNAVLTEFEAFENKLLALEAEALGAVADIVGGLSDLALNLESGLLGELDAAIDGITGELTKTMDSIIEQITIPDGGGLSNIQDLISKGLDSAVAAQGFANNIKTTIGGAKNILPTLEKSFDNITDELTDISALKASLNLDLTNCT